MESLTSTIISILKTNNIPDSQDSLDIHDILEVNYNHDSHNSHDGNDSTDSPDIPDIPDIHCLTKDETLLYFMPKVSDESHDPLSHEYMFT